MSSDEGVRDLSHRIRKIILGSWDWELSGDRIGRYNYVGKLRYRGLSSEVCVRLWQLAVESVG